MPICLWWVRKRLIHIAPQGSVVVDAVKVTKLSFTKGGVRHFIKGDQEQLWNKAKPSQMAAYGIVPKREGWVNWDDDFGASPPLAPSVPMRNGQRTDALPRRLRPRTVDELKRAVKACKLFLFFPVRLDLALPPPPGAGRRSDPHPILCSSRSSSWPTEAWTPSSQAWEAA